MIKSINLFSRQNKNIAIYYIAFLWLIVLLPKEIQFFLVSGCLAFALLCNVKINIIQYRKGYIFFLLYAVIHLISIIIAIVSRDYEIKRIFASFNTCGVWVLAVGLAGMVLSGPSIDSDDIGRVCAFNIAVMFAIIVLTWGREASFTIINETRFAWGGDLLSSGETIRYVGYLEYPTLVFPFVMFQFPWAFSYMMRKNKLASLVLIPISALPIFMTLSRMGILIFCFIIFITANLWMLNRCKNIKMVIRGYIAFFMCLTALLLVKLETISNLVIRYINSRPGSNNSRMEIYSNSIKRINETSWLLGAGVKEMLGKYPLGSHSTYLGILYKSGIIGFSIFFIGTISLLVRLILQVYKVKIEYAIGLCTYILAWGMFFIFEDIDGANWLIFTVFVFCAVIDKMSCETGSEIKRKNEAHIDS